MDDSIELGYLTGLSPIYLKPTTYLISIKVFFLLKENPLFTDLDIHCESAYTRHGTKHREYLSEPGQHGPTL